MRVPSAWWLAAVSLMIAGCGGGGGGTTCTSNCVTSVLSVGGVTPANGATGVAITSAVTATFSEGLNAGSITSSTFTLVPQGGSAISGTVSYNSANLTATFTPTASLAYSTTYTATITTGVQSTVGTALASNYTWSFTTAPVPAPTATVVTPANGSIGVAITSTVTATFSEAMNAGSITGSTFTLAPQGGSAIAATVSYSSTGNVATLTPSAPLAYNTTYTAEITTGVTASTGAALAANYTWTFTTATAPPPLVTAVTPTNASTGVAITAAVTATFNEAMMSSTITASTFTLTGPGSTSVQGTVTYNNQIATFTPAANLSYNTAYTATISTTVTSSAGVALSAPYTWTFTTTTAPVPTVTSTAPTSGATGVNIGNALTATFSQPMNSSTITASTFTLNGPGNTAVAGLVTFNTGTSTATFTPNASLAYNTFYTATITTGATSSAGATLASNYTWSFTTGANPNQVTVDFGMTYQTIRGFGGSTAWLGALTTQQATALFNPTICTASNAGSCGLGLSILRVRIDPEGTSTTTPPYYTGEWATELTNAQEANSANSNAIVFASPWTPPASMKTSSSSQPYYSGTPACSPGGNSSDYCGGYLNPTNYAAYATYLEDFVTYFANNGVNLYAISMQNEPDYSDAAGENYESCSWPPQQMDAWIASLAGNNPLTTKLMMPESFNFSVTQAQTAMDDPSAEPQIGILAGHLYGVTPSSAYYSLAQASTNKPDVWMTEHSLTPAGSSPAIGDALALAEEIHNSMTVGEFKAYVYWWIWDDPSDSVNFGLINSSTTSPSPTYYGDAIGQFSNFIQPGYVRVSATANPVSGVYVSAYSNTSPSHYVIVAINSNTSSESLTFVLNNGSGVTSLTPYESTSSAGLAAQTAVSASGGQFSYTLPAQSIVTFYQ
ncbi:MAG: Ig-like domain-containing protein [Terracidiphilus sp.]